MNWFLKYWRLIKRGKTYRVILIDPEARSIKELQSDASLDSNRPVAQKANGRERRYTSLVGFPQRTILNFCGHKALRVAAIGDSISRECITGQNYFTRSHHVLAELRTRGGRRAHHTPESEAQVPISH
jgi:hypothetical protein